MGTSPLYLLGDDDPGAGSGAAVPGRMEAIRGGDDGAFNTFYDQYAVRLHRYLFTVSGGSDALAKEALQAAMLKVIRYAKALPDGEAEWRWLARLGRTALFDIQKGERRRSDREQRFAADPTEADSPSAAEERLHAALAEVLEETPPEDRRLVEGVYFERRSQEELAVELGVSRKAVESRLARIRVRMREKLKTQLGK